MCNVQFFTTEFAAYLPLYLWIVVIGWFLAEKAGFSGILALLLLVPVINVVLVLLFVFVEWPVRSDLARYKKRYGELTAEDDEVVAALTATTCLSCGASMQPGETTCSDCG
jgi:hypothetical protein